jgi:hypothetical protein
MSISSEYSSHDTYFLLMLEILWPYFRHKSAEHTEYEKKWQILMYSYRF